MRFPPREVNADPRNPDLLPTFLRVIPKRRRHHPQFFPMVRATGGRRRAVAIGPAGAVATLALALTSEFGLGVLNAGARSANESEVTAAQYLSTGALGDAAGDGALGLRTPYFEPPALSDPATPGFTIDSGAEQLTPSCSSRAGGTTSSPRRTKCRRTSRSAPAPPWVSGAVRVTRCPTHPPGPIPASPGHPTWPSSVRTTCCTSRRSSGGSPPPPCASATPSAPRWPAPTSPRRPRSSASSRSAAPSIRAFVDADGQPYMVWKSDQNARSNAADTQIYSQPLSAYGLHLLGQPTVIFGPDEPWQGHIVEAPQLVMVRGNYFLFYSGGWFNQPGYSIGAARCTGPLRPCTDISPTPLLGSNAQGQGPGEESVFANAAGYWLLYTPFSSTLPRPGPPRPVAMAHLGFGPSGPYLAAPLEAAASG